MNIDDDIVERQVFGNFLAVARDFGGQQQAIFLGKTAVEQIIHAGQQVVAGYVRHEPEAALIDADQRHAITSQAARRVEHGAVAAEHDRQIGMGANVVETAGHPPGQIDFFADVL